ncbi:MAG: hypothetical protein ACLUW6_02055 [Coriobacteriaceae bacterium]
MALTNPSYAGSTPGYEANSLENNYFIGTGDILEWSDPVADQILQKLSRGDVLQGEGNQCGVAPAHHKNPINNLVAYELNRAVEHRQPDIRCSRAC